MPKIALSKAENLDNELFSQTEIVICGRPPEHQSLTHAHHWYQAEAERLGEVLWKSLPGGTIDQLIIWLLEKTASHLKISRFPQEEE